METDFIKLFQLLNEGNVDFVVVGGVAAIAHGSPLVTQDIDTCISLAPDNLDRLKDALSEINPIHRIGNKNKPFNETDGVLYSFKNIYLTTDYGQIDCLGEITGIGSYEDVLRNSFKLQIDGKEYNFLTIDALIKAKKAINRPKDREAVIILNALREKQRKK